MMLIGEKQITRQMLDAAYEIGLEIPEINKDDLNEMRCHASDALHTAKQGLILRSVLYWGKACEIYENKIKDKL